MWGGSAISTQAQSLDRPGASGPGELAEVLALALVYLASTWLSLTQAALSGGASVVCASAGVAIAGLHRLGYGLKPDPDYDAETETTVRAFQRHWRPARVDGVADGETRARLVGLLQLASVESVTGVLD